MAEHICPVWVGYLLASPVRKIFQNPEKMLTPYIQSGMMVVDVGCAMGFFSLPMARMVGRGGRVISVDVQEAMLKSLERRAQKVNLSDRITLRLCGYDRLDLDDLKAKIVRVAKERGLQYDEMFVNKTCNFQELLDVRHSVMLLGPAGCACSPPLYRMRGRARRTTSVGFVY